MTPRTLDEDTGRDVRSRKVTGVTVVGFRGISSPSRRTSVADPSLTLTGLPGAGVQDAREP
jgi:hypothetical protein